MIASIMVWSFEPVSSLKFSDVCICSLSTCTGLIKVRVLIQSFKICNSCSLIGSCFRLFLNVSIPVSKSCNSTDRIKLPVSIFDGLCDVGNHSGSIGATWILLDFLSISQCSSSTGRICRNTRFSLLVLNKEGSGSLEAGMALAKAFVAARQALSLRGFPASASFLKDLAKEAADNVLASRGDFPSTIALTYSTPETAHGLPSMTPGQLLMKARADSRTGSFPFTTACLQAISAFSHGPPAGSLSPLL